MSADFLTVTDTERRTHLVRAAFIQRMSECRRVDGYSYASGFEVLLADGERILVYKSEGERLRKALAEAAE